MASDINWSGVLSRNFAVSDLNAIDASRGGHVAAVTEALQHSQRDLLVGRVVVRDENSSALRVRFRRSERGLMLVMRLAAQPVAQHGLKCVKELRRTNRFH